MGHRSELTLFCRESPYTVIVEPWAEEFLIETGARCRVVALNSKVVPTFEVELNGAVLIVCVNESGSTYEFWRADVKEFETPIPIPRLPEFSE